MKNASNVFYLCSYLLFLSLTKPLFQKMNDEFELTEALNELEGLAKSLLKLQRPKIGTVCVFKSKVHDCYVRGETGFYRVTGFVHVQ